MDTGDWITSIDRSGRRYAYAETPLGRCTLKLARAAGNASVYRATLADGRRIASAGSLEELKIEAVYHVNRLTTEAQPPTPRSDPRPLADLHDDVDWSAIEADGPVPPRDNRCY